MDILSMTLGIKLYLKPYVAVDLYDVAGPELDTRQWLRIQGSPSSTACGAAVDYATFGGADASLIAKLSIFDYTIAETPPLTVFSDEFPLSSGSFPSCP
jgi:hypothetical protein